MGKMQGAKAGQNCSKLWDNLVLACFLQSVSSFVGWEDTNLNSNQSGNANI